MLYWILGATAVATGLATLLFRSYKRFMYDQMWQVIEGKVGIRENPEVSKRAFWALAHSHPEWVYTFCREDPEFVVMRQRDAKQAPRWDPDESWAGPFHVTVPSLGGETVTVYGRVPGYTDSQFRLLRIVREQFTSIEEALDDEAEDER